MKKRSIILWCILMTNAVMVLAQKRDTIRITAKDLNPRFLREGTHRYLVYAKMKKDSVRTMTQFWTRTVKRGNYNGTPAFEINQEWEDKDSVMHLVRSYINAGTMQPLYHKTWWKVQQSRNATTKTTSTTIVDMVKKTVEYNNVLLSDKDTARQVKKIWDSYKTSVDKFYLNWHLDLETFPLLPYRKGVTFLIPFYDPGTIADYQKVAYTVTEEAVLDGYDNQKIKCWLLVHESSGNKEVFWISQKTREVLKLEQVFGPGVYRYKIKLSYSN